MTTPMSAVDNVERERTPHELANYLHAYCGFDPKSLFHTAVHKAADLIQQQAALIASLQGELAAKEAAAKRYQQIIDDPESARHLLHLLQQGKGNAEAFARMLDRIRLSKDAALTSAAKPVEDAPAVDKGKGETKCQDQ